MALISGTTDYQGFAHRDVVIEAVFEDGSQTADGQRSGTIRRAADHLCVEYSSLPIGDIAAHASRPGQVIGLHFSVRWKNAAG